MLNGQKVEISLGNNFDPVPVDKYTVQCIDVSLKTQPKYKSSEEEEVLNYKFAILDDKEMEVTDESGEKKTGSTRGRYLWKGCRLALGKGAWLRLLAEAAVGRAMTPDELKTFDPESIVGKQIDVLVEHKTSNENTYVNISSFNVNKKPLKPVDDSEIKQTGQVKVQATAPAVAPDADEEADKLISSVKEEAAPETVADQSEDSDDVAVLEAQLKLAKAKAAAAKK